MAQQAITNGSPINNANGVIQFGGTSFNSQLITNIPISDDNQKPNDNIVSIINPPTQLNGIRFINTSSGLGTPGSIIPLQNIGITDTDLSGPPYQNPSTTVEFAGYEGSVNYHVNMHGEKIIYDSVEYLVSKQSDSALPASKVFTTGRDTAFATSGLFNYSVGGSVNIGSYKVTS